jgi:hypothetical protein
MANWQSIGNLLRRKDMRIQMGESINFLPLNNVRASSGAKKFE